MSDLSTTANIVDQLLAEKLSGSGGQPEMERLTQIAGGAQLEPALKGTDRMRYSFADDWGKRQILSQYYDVRPVSQGGQLVQLKNGEYGIRTQLGVKPVDPKGFQLRDLPNDIADMTGKSIPTAGQLFGGVAGAPAGLLGSATLSGVGGGVGEALRQRIGQQMGVRQGYDIGEIGLETALGFGGDLVGAGVGKVASKVTGSFGAKNADDILSSVMSARGGNAIDPITGIPYGPARMAKATAGEKISYLTGQKVDDKIADHAIDALIHNPEKLDLNPFTAAGRYDDKMYDTAMKKILPAFDYLEKSRSSMWKTAWENLPESARKTPLDTSKVITQIDDILTQRGLIKTLPSGKMMILSKKASPDLKKLISFRKEIVSNSGRKKPLTGEQLQQLKLRLSDEINWDAFHNPNVAKSAFDSIGSKVYGQLSEIINNTLGMSSANKKFSEMSRALDIARPFARPRRLEALVERTTKDPTGRHYIQEAFQGIDDYLPEGMKFMDELMNTEASRALADFGFTGSAAGSPKTLLQRYVFTPGALIRTTAAAKKLGLNTKPLTDLLGKAAVPAAKVLQTEEGRRIAGQMTARVSLNQILYQNQQ